MHYRLKDLPIQAPATTAFLAQNRGPGATGLLEALVQRRKRSEDCRLPRGDLKISEVGPRGISFSWQGSGGNRPLSPNFVQEIASWTGFRRKDFIHALHESPATLQGRIE